MCLFYIGVATNIQSDSTTNWYYDDGSNDNNIYLKISLVNKGNIKYLYLFGHQKTN